MEEEKKTSFVSILIVLGLIALFVVIVIKMINHNNESNEAGNIEEVQMNSEYEAVYDSMVTKDKYFGLYYNKKVTIDDIDENDMVKFMITKYLDQNNISVKENMSCFTNDSGVFIGTDNCKEVTKISKLELDNFIKEKYNTTRVFNSSSGIVPLVAPTNYVFDNNTQTYYIGFASRSGGDTQIIRMLTKIEGNEEYLYFYDKAMYCVIGWGSAKCLKSNNIIDGTLFEIAESDFNSNRKELIVGETTGDDGHKYTTYEFDYDYIFDNYEVLSFKHIFKKINNNYYWISSEVL